MSELNDIFQQKFIERFNAPEQASKIISAALEHNNDIHNEPGDSVFQWAIVICIGYQCLDKYRDDHGITVSFDELKQWIIDEEVVGSFSGTPDYLALLCGTYNEYVGLPPFIESEANG